MAKSKPDRRNQKRRKAPSGPEVLTPEMAQPLLSQASVLLESGQAAEALPVALKSLKCLSSPDVLPVSQLPVLELLGEIHVELGDIEQARARFTEAVELDEDGQLPEEAGGGADKFLWLAQLSEEGGEDSVGWFAKGCAVLRRDLGEYTGKSLSEEDEAAVEMKKRKLANALCGAAEVYMTDLSWEDDAEARCESLVTEACLVAPESPEPLQTLASVRLSQTKLEDARSALQRSLDLWKDLPPEDEDVPDFPTRISLARLLMEADMEDRAIDVLDRLVAEDDSSVEAWYLGGWCLHLLSDKQKPEQMNGSTGDELSETRLDHLKNSRRWLQNSLRLYSLLEYEDERLHEHAEELVQGLNETLGPAVEGEGDDEEWEDEEEGDSEDEEMADT